MLIGMIAAPTPMHTHGLPVGIDGTRTDLATEFHRRPFGRHSPDLQALLHHMRGGPMEGKYFLWMLEPHSKWSLARYSQTHPLVPEKLGPEFDSIEDAERFVFRLRWKTMFGSEPEIG